MNIYHPFHFSVQPAHWKTETKLLSMVNDTIEHMELDWGDNCQAEKNQTNKQNWEMNDFVHLYCLNVLISKRRPDNFQDSWTAYQEPPFEVFTINYLTVWPVRFSWQPYRQKMLSLEVKYVKKDSYKEHRQTDTCTKRKTGTWVSDMTDHQSYQSPSLLDSHISSNTHSECQQNVKVT